MEIGNLGQQVPSLYCRGPFDRESALTRLFVGAVPTAPLLSDGELASYASIERGSWKKKPSKTTVSHAGSSDSNLARNPEVADSLSVPVGTGSDPAPLFYAVTIAGVRLIVLDGSDRRIEQMEWLESELQSRESQNALERVVVVHTSPFEEYRMEGGQHDETAKRRGTASRREGAADEDGDRGWMEEHIAEYLRAMYVPLWERYGVGLVISGSSPVYERGQRHGITYVSLGGVSFARGGRGRGGGGGQESDNDGRDRHSEGAEGGLRKVVKAKDWGMYTVTASGPHYGLLKIGFVDARRLERGSWKASPSRSSQNTQRSSTAGRHTSSSSSASSKGKDDGSAEWWDSFGVTPELALSVDVHRASDNVRVDSFQLERGEKRGGDLHR